MVMMALPTDSANLKAKPQFSSSRLASSQEALQVSRLVVAMAVTTVLRTDSADLAAKPNNPPPHSEWTTRNRSNRTKLKFRPFQANKLPTKEKESLLPLMSLATRSKEHLFACTPLQVASQTSHSEMRERLVNA